MTAETRKRWDGGYIHVQQDGRPLFILERRRGKHRFHISTRTHSETAAHAHLRRFEADPWGYAQEMKSGRLSTDGLFLTAELLTEYRTWMLTRDRPATTKYANESFHRLSEWAEDLTGLDLRSLDLPVLKAKLAKRGTSRQHRIIAIKALFSWLREEKGVLDRAKDVTLDWPVPQAVPEKHRRRKAVPAQNVRKVLAKLRDVYRDPLLLLANTGWHTTELARFAKGGDIAEARGRVLAVLQVQHKSGSTTRTPVMDGDVLAAARRLRKRGNVPRGLNAAMRAACRAARVGEFTAGVMRHSVATWAVEAGTPMEQIAEFLGHRDPSTTRQFYADAAVPTRGVRLPKF